MRAKDDRRQRVRLFDYLLDRPMPPAGWLAIAVALLEAAADWTTWVELHVPAVYGVPLVLAAVARNRRLVWVLTAFLVFMNFASYMAQIRRGAFSFAEPFFINRALSAVSLIITAALCHVWIVAGSRLAAQRRSLARQNEELDRLRRIAEEANARKTQLLAAVSHDIRTPLTSIDLIAQLILRSGESADLAARLPEWAARLRYNTRSLTDLASTLVDISALDAGRVAVSTSDFSLNELLQEQRERLLPLAQAKGLFLALEQPEPAIWLRADRVKLTRVVGNLVGNAIKFTAKGGVTIRTALSASRAVVIEIRDTGVGMSPDSLRRIFDEYGQLGNPERDSKKGWGLGLAISRRLVEVIGGAITVESEPQRGTTFSVHLPASSVRVRPALNEPSPAR
jgi:signal transduction histidine kinase